MLERCPIINLSASLQARTPAARRPWQTPPIKKLVFVTNGIFPVTDRHGADLSGLIRGAERHCKSFKINNIKS
jgi:hypothetical protein